MPFKKKSDPKKPRLFFPNFDISFSKLQFTSEPKIPPGTTINTMQHNVIYMGNGKNHKKE